MKNDIPAKVTDVGQYAEVVSHVKICWLANPGSKEEMVQAVIEVISNLAMAQREGEKLQKHVRQSYSAIEF